MSNAPCSGFSPAPEETIAKPKKPNISDLSQYTIAQSVMLARCECVVRLRLLMPYPFRYLDIRHKTSRLFWNFLDKNRGFIDLRSVTHHMYRHHTGSYWHQWTQIVGGDHKGTAFAQLGRNQSKKSKSRPGRGLRIRIFMSYTNTRNT